MIYSEGGLGRISPESSSIEFLAKSSAKMSALDIKRMVVVPSGLKRRAKDEEQKLLEMFLTRSQKSRELLEFVKY